MKRIVLFALVISMLVGSFAYAEEKQEAQQYTYIVSVAQPDHMSIVYNTDEKVLSKVYYTFYTKEEKQPLIFQGTEENPKTGFSYMTPEEVATLKKIVRTETYTESGRILDTDYIILPEDGFITAFANLESLFVQKKQGDVKKEIRTSNTGKKTDDTFSLSVWWYEEKLLYEQLAAFYINQLVPHVTIAMMDKGTALEKLNLIYISNTADFDRIFWVAKKSKERIEREQEYVRQVLLSITEEEFNEALGYLTSQFYHYVCKNAKGERYFRINPRSK